MIDRWTQRKPIPQRGRSRTAPPAVFRNR